MSVRAFRDSVSRRDMAEGSARRRYTLAILLAVYTCNFMDRQILAILKPAIKRELLLSDTQLSGLAFTLFYAMLGVPLGMWADRVRRTSLVAAALFLFSGMTALSGLARGFGSLLLARIGVGVGEAGTNPASHAMIADLYPAQARSGAMAVFALGPHLGLLLGLLLGGLVSGRYGWRAAFLAAGLPGLVLAAVTYLTVEEPARREPGQAPSGSSARTLAAAAREMWGQPALRHVLVGADLPRPVPRHVAPAERGDAGADRRRGGLGTWTGGWLADHLRRRDRRWPLWIPALALAGSAPLWLGAYLVPHTPFAAGLLVLPGSLLGVFIGPSFALVQELVDPRRRALSSALLHSPDEDYSCDSNAARGTRL